MTTASWYHCSVKTVSRSAGRSVVAAAAYRLGERLHDERYDQVQDYTRRRGVDSTFTIGPADAPEWALNPERLWNAAERAETRKNSTLAREVELALPSLLSSEEQQSITEKFAEALVDRYQVAVSVAIHSASSKGDERNAHAHILFTTREMLPEGLGKKTRVLDDKKTGPQEVVKLRQLAADLINDALTAANSDIRVDHRSFKERGIPQEPTTHLGPAASGMEQRGEPSDRGDINRDAQQHNRETEQNSALIEERQSLDKAIDTEQDRITSPPQNLEDAQERMREAAQPFSEAIVTQGRTPDIQSDGHTWWQRTAGRLAQKARSLAIGLVAFARDYWQQKSQETNHERNRDDGGLER